MTSDGKDSSVHPIVGNNDTYQDTTLDSGTYNASKNIDFSEYGDEHRDVVSSLLPAPSTVDDARASKFDEFKTLSDNSQCQVAVEILRWFHDEKLRRDPGLLDRTLRFELSQVLDRFDSDVSRQQHQPRHELNEKQSESDFVDGDTEFYELPTPRPGSTQKEDDTIQKVLGIDESKAELVIKKIMEKMECIKLREKERRKAFEKRSPVTASTPQKPCMHYVIAQDSSTTTSTTTSDTEDFPMIKVVQLKARKKKPKKAKFAYLETLNENYKPARTRPSAPKVIYIHDRCVQTDLEPNSLTKHQHEPPEKDAPATEREVLELKEESIDAASAGRGQEVRPDSNHNRVSSFHRSNGFSSKPDSHEKVERPVPQKSVAWYEPYQYEPPWMDRPTPATRQQPRPCAEKPSRQRGLECLSLREALVAFRPEFISQLQQRQRHIAINAEERRLQELWADEREQLFGLRREAVRRQHRVRFARKRAPMSRADIVAGAREKYQKLPEVLQRKRDEQRKKEYAANREKRRLFLKKVQNRVLGRSFNG